MVLLWEKEILKIAESRTQPEGDTPEAAPDSTVPPGQVNRDNNC